MGSADIMVVGFKRSLIIESYMDDVSSLYGWLFARVQTGNYCFWIDSDVHVRSRCIAPDHFRF